MPDALRIRPVCCDCGHNHLPHDCCLSPPRPVREGAPTFYPRNYGITKPAYTWRVRTCTACDVSEGPDLRLSSFAGDRFLCSACLDALFQLVHRFIQSATSKATPTARSALHWPWRDVK